jgi:hypothetical protein
MKVQSRRRARALPIVGAAVLALAGSVLFTAAASAKLPKNTSGDPRATYHAGNVTPDGNGNNTQGCTGSSTDITSTLNVTINDPLITINPPYPTAPFSIFVKGGPAWNQYDYTAGGSVGGSGPPPLFPNAANLTDLHPPVNNGGNIAGISHWFGCGSTAPPPAGLDVSFAYADTAHSAPPAGTFPSPFLGATVFCGGTTDGLYDAGAIRLHNTTGSPIVVADVTVEFGPPPIVYGDGVGSAPGSPKVDWRATPTGQCASVTIPVGGDLVLTQTNSYNFDSSDLLPADCADHLGTAPKVNITVGLTTKSVVDTALILIHHGNDCGALVNESIPWGSTTSVTF